MSIESYAEFAAFSEAYETVKTVELVGNNGSTYRIDVLKCYHNPNVPFTTRTYVRRDFILQPAYPADSGGPTGRPEKASVWVLSQGAAWTARDTPQSVLRQAMSFLADAVRAGMISDGEPTP